MAQISPPDPPVSANSSLKVSLTHQPVAWLYALWKFSRPHTIIGTSLSTIGLLGIAWSIQPASSWLSAAQILLAAWTACLCGNVYIVGLNQIEDVDIDRINKPHLPLASGEFSPLQAKTIVILTGLFAIALSLTQGIFLFATVGLSLLIGTAYSLPPVRLKRFPFWASFCILSVRGGIVNLGLFLHYRQQISSQPLPTIPPFLWALTLFIVVFSFAIAIFKDIPDIEGDRQFNINTFTVQLGQQAVFSLARWVLTACYVSMMGAGFFLTGVNRPFLITSHAVALGLCWLYSFRVDWQSPAPSPQSLSYPQFYQFIWKLFFMEYLIFPAACLLA